MFSQVLPVSDTPWGFLCLIVIVLYGAWQIKEGNRTKLELAKLSVGQGDIQNQQQLTAKKLDGLLEGKVKDAGDLGRAAGVTLGIKQEQDRIKTIFPSQS